MKIQFLTFFIFVIGSICLGNKYDTTIHYNQIRNQELNCFVIKNDSVLLKNPIYCRAFQCIQNVKDSISKNDSSKMTIQIKKCLLQSVNNLNTIFIPLINESLECYAKSKSIAYIVNLSDSSLFYARNKGRQYYMPEEYFHEGVPPGKKIHHNLSVISLVMEYNKGDITDSLQEYINNDKKFKLLEPNTNRILKQFYSCIQI